MRVAVGAVAKRLLEEFGIEVISHVLSIGGVFAKVPQALPAQEIRKRAEGSELHCSDHEAEKTNDEKDRRGAGSRRHAGRRVRADHHRRSRRAREPRALATASSTAGWRGRS